MTQDLPDRELDELYAAPPDRFVETRKRLAGALRDSGRGDAAAYVRGVKKPSIAASAINRAVHANRRQAEDLVAAARELRRAHSRAFEEGRESDRRFLRDAVAQEREAVKEMAAAAGALLEGEAGAVSAETRRRIEETLGAIALDDGVMERFARGRLEREARAAGLSLPAGEPEGRGRGPSPDRAERRDEAKRKRARDAELRRARNAVAAKRRAVDKARAERDRKRAALEQAEQKLREADAALQEAERKLVS